MLDTSKTFSQYPGLPIALGHTLQLVLLLDGVRVAASLGGVDQLLSKALSNALDVSESGFTGTNGEKRNGLIDTAERGDIDSLSSYGTSASNPGAVFTWTAVDDGINGDLDGVLVGHDVDLNTALSDSALLFNLLRSVTYDFESMCHNSDCHQLLAIVTSIHHEGVCESFDYGALRLSEALRGIATGGVGDVHGVSDVDVIGK